jgi:hypothetical protein
MTYILVGILIFLLVNIGITLSLRWWDKHGWF